MKALDISGRRFGQLTAIERNGRQGANTVWLCRCSCGKHANKQLGELRDGRATRCGSCGRSQRNTTHGLSRHPLYAKWSAIRSRCEDPNNPDYANYGGRGICLSLAWTDPATFIRDLLAKPGHFPGATLDREDNDGPYSNENTRWATAAEQSRNTRRSRKGNQ